MEDLPEQQTNPRLVEPSPVAPQTEQTKPDAGTKLFVLFFFLLIPPLGVVIVAAVCWKLYRAMTAG